jgi:hypothetical protein
MSAISTLSRKQPQTSIEPPEAPVASDLPSTPIVPGSPYWGDRVGLAFWLTCAGLLVLLHISQHVSYLLR